MLSNIKTIDILKNIVSNLNTVIKLGLIKYNKNLREELNIGIIDYRIFSQKYFIGERNGRGKEYDCLNKNLIFEGEYKNGKRNGKGKEYDCLNKTLIFEGEYINGLRNREGKEYNKKQILIFEGEYKDGKKWNGEGFSGEINKITVQYKIKDGNGYVKQYYSNTHFLSFEGEYKNGLRNGKGKEYYYYQDLKFEGEYLNGLKHGKGIEYNFDRKLLFDGYYYRGRRWNGIIYDEKNNIVGELKNGKGFVKEYNYGHIIFEGEYINGAKNGYGKEYDDEENLVYEGEYLNGLKHGKGKQFFRGVLIFEGEYLYNTKRKGKEYIDGKLVFEGEYILNKKWEGKGYDEEGNIIYELHNGAGKIIEYIPGRFSNSKFEGEYLNGDKNGYGKEYYGKKLKFEGEYLNGKRNGKGKEYCEGKVKFEGEYLNGERNGKGKEYFEKVLRSHHKPKIIDGGGKPLYEGEYLNGKRHGKGKEYRNGKLIFEG